MNYSEIDRAFLSAEVAKAKCEITEWVGALLVAQSAVVVVCLLIFA